MLICMGFVEQPFCKRVMQFFEATPEKQGQSALIGLHFGYDRITLVGINYKDDTTNGLRFLGELGNPFAAVGTDPNGKAAIDWGVYGIPETFLVGKDGTIVYKQVGPFTDKSLRDGLMPEIEKLLQ